MLRKELTVVDSIPQARRRPALGRMRDWGGRRSCVEFGKYMYHTYLASAPGGTRVGSARAGGRTSLCGVRSVRHGGG